MAFNFLLNYVSALKLKKKSIFRKKLEKTLLCAQYINYLLVFNIAVYRGLDVLTNDTLHIQINQAKSEVLAICYFNINPSHLLYLSFFLKNVSYKNDSVRLLNTVKLLTY